MKSNLKTIKSHIEQHKVKPAQSVSKAPVEHITIPVVSAPVKSIQNNPVLKEQQDNYPLKQQRDAPIVKQQQDASVLKQQHDAILLRQQQEIANLRQQLDEAVRREAQTKMMHELEAFRAAEQLKIMQELNAFRIQEQNKIIHEQKSHMSKEQTDDLHLVAMPVSPAVNFHIKSSNLEVPIAYGPSRKSSVTGLSVSPEDNSYINPHPASPAVQGSPAHYASTHLVGDTNDTYEDLEFTD